MKRKRKHQQDEDGEMRLSVMLAADFLFWAICCQVFASDLWIAGSVALLAAFMWWAVWGWSD